MRKGSDRSMASSKFEVRGSKEQSPTSSLQLPAAGGADVHAPRARLSVVVLTKNEERRIARCLESARWADELIVVDGESQDRTVEICRSYGATIVSRAFSGDFGAERNAGDAVATGDWMLQLDADDTVSAGLCAQIERILREGSPHTAYKMRRKNWFLGHEMRHGGWYHYYPHFYRRGRAHFEGRVHHLLRAEGPLGILEGALEHRPFDSLEQFIARQNRYTALEAQEMLDKQGALDSRLVRYHITTRPFKLVWKLYVKKGGFREGWHGLIFSILYGWVHFMKWAKYWELCERASARAMAPPTSPDAPAARARGQATLAVVLMTKNEETRLAACLDRVA